MNKQAILHIQDSQYCYALDSHTVQLMLRCAADDMFDSVSVIYGNKYDYYKKRKKATLTPGFSDADFVYYTAKLKIKDVRFVYIFEIVYCGAVYYFSEDGLTSSYDYKLAYYNSFQLPYVNYADIMDTVEWMKSAVFYEIFIDRFYRGNRQKDGGYINLKWGKLPNPKSFAGGDLDGVTAKLDYLKRLGVNALYLTPIFKSVSNHKYDISDYYAVDEMFGGKEAFSRLVKEAHARGIKIVLDAVFNHCSEELAEFKDVLKNGKNSPYFGWFIIDGDKIDAQRANYEYFSLCKYMPKFNTSNPEVQKYLNDIATYWVREFDIDGWRLDVSDEVSHDYWRSFRKAVKAVKPDCVILGENWHDSHPYLRGDQFDAIMNYALTKACTDYFISGALDAEGFAKKLGGLYVRNTRQVNSMMLNLLDNHDTHRFYTLAGRDINKLICALAVIYMHTGAPCVYYGTEIPLEGGYDPDCRRTMVWKGRNRAMRKIIITLGQIRKKKEIIEGDISFSAADGMFILERTLKNKIRLTVNNRAEKPFCAEGKILLSHNYSNGILAANGFVIEWVKFNKGGKNG